LQKDPESLAQPTRGKEDTKKRPPGKRAESAAQKAATEGHVSLKQPATYSAPKT